MKRNKFLLIAILILVFSVPAFLSACGFISYNKGQSQSDKEYQQSLTAQKQHYIEKLENLSSQELYFESDVREYILSLTEGKNQINDCETIEELEGIFNANAEIIKSIATEAESKAEYCAKLNAVSSAEIYRKAEREQFEFFIENGLSAIDECTDRASLEAVYIAYKSEIEKLKTATQYEAEEAAALANYKDEKTAEICAHVNLEDYRAEERQAIENALENYSEKIAQAADYSAIDNFVREYKIEIYPLKTHAELYAEELLKLKADEIKSINNHVNLIDYRYDETLIIQTVIASFTQQIEDCTDKESVISLSENCKLILNGVKDDKTLYEEEKVSLAEERYEQLLSFADLVYLTDEDKDAYFIHCGGIKADMLKSQSKSEVNRIFISEKKQLFEAGAIADDLTCLNYYQDALIEELDYYLDVSLYRAEQCKDISRICDSGAFKIRKCSTYSSTMSEYDNTIAQLDGVLTNDEMWEQEDNEFRALLNSLYGENILAEPDSLTQADDYFELAKIIDYYAFYQKDFGGLLRDKFRVHLNYEHKTAQYEINEVYWYCELIRSAAGITGEFENSDYLVIELIPYEIAANSNAEAIAPVERYQSLVEYDSDKSSMQKREEDFDGFGYKNYGREITGIWNTQQLWYALEHEYVPVCVPNSVAEQCLNRAKEILREIIMDGMSVEEKVFSIFSWFGENVRYDYLYTKYLGSGDMDRFPDEQAATLDSFHVEGALINGIAVCEGYAKSYLLFLRLEGIESYRVFVRHANFKGHNSINAQGLGLPGYGSHAFVSVKASDGLFYYSDSEQSYVSGRQELKSYNQIMVPPSLLSGYIGGFTYMYRDMEFGENIAGIYEKLTLNSNSVFVKDIEGLTALINDFGSVEQSKTQLSIIYNAAQYVDFKRDLQSLNCFDYIERSASDGKVFLRELIIYK